jgi:hypothetical protein
MANGVTLPFNSASIAVASFRSMFMSIAFMIVLQFVRLCR